MKLLPLLRFVLCMGAMGTCHCCVHAQDRVVLPKAGDPIRKILFNAMRPAFEKDLKQKVIFQVRVIRLYKDWAFLEGTPLQPNQKPINYKKTVYQGAINGDMFDDGYSALLHKTNGQWKLVTYDIGATDVSYGDWWKRFHAPKAVIPYNE